VRFVDEYGAGRALDDALFDRDPVEVGERLAEGRVQRCRGSVAKLMDVADLRHGALEAPEARVVDEAELPGMDGSQRSAAQPRLLVGEGQRSPRASW